MAEEVKSDSETHSYQLDDFDITTGLFRKNDNKVRDAVFFDPKSKTGAIFRGNNYQQMEDLFQKIKLWYGTFLLGFFLTRFYKASVVIIRIMGRTIHISRHGDFHVYENNSKISSDTIINPEWVLITSDGFVDLVSPKIDNFVKSADRMTAARIDQNHFRKDDNDASFLFITRSDRTGRPTDNVSPAVLYALVLL